MSNNIVVQDLRLKVGRLEINVPDLEFEQGKTSCIIGRSGSGKSLLAAAIYGHDQAGFEVSGTVSIDGRLAAKPLWKEHVFVLPQEPVSALDPTMPVGKQIGELFRWRADRDCFWNGPDDVGLQVGLSLNDLKKYPGQLSGGMQQRVMIAMVLVARAEFVIADEPTKGLDDENKAIVIGLFQKVKASGRGLIVITHDLDVANALADNVIVMDNGCVVEQGHAQSVLENPQSSATCALIQNEPSNWPATERIDHKKAASILSLEHVTFCFDKSMPLFNDVSIDIHEGDVIGLYGPSGVGKSTLADICLGLRPPYEGNVCWFGEALTTSCIKMHRVLFQKLFQNPLTSFPPKIKLAEVFERLTPMAEVSDFSLDALFSRLDLDKRLLMRRSDQVSGGELQRLAIVRLLLAQPKFLVCDEPSSRLDMSIQRLAIDIITDYASEASAAVLLISHDRTILQKRAHSIFELTEEGQLKSQLRE